MKEVSKNYQKTIKQLSKNYQKLSKNYEKNLSKNYQKSIKKTIKKQTHIKKFPTFLPQLSRSSPMADAGA